MEKQLKDRERREEKQLFLQRKFASNSPPGPNPARVPPPPQYLGEPMFWKPWLHRSTPLSLCPSTRVQPPTPGRPQFCVTQGVGGGG